MQASALRQSVFRTEDWAGAGYAYHEPSAARDVVQPAIGSSHAWLLGNGARDHVLLGVGFARPTNFPEAMDYDRIADQVENLKVLEDAVDVWAIRSLPYGRYDLKTYVERKDDRYGEFMNAGNFVYGVSGRRLGIDRHDLDVAAGLLSIATAALRGSWEPEGGPNAPFLGDDPLDATYSRMGQDYFDSGQEVIDFFEEPSRLPPGRMRERAQLKHALTRPAYEEARLRLGPLAGREDLAKRLAGQALKRRRFEARRGMERMIEAERQRLALVRAEEERQRERDAAERAAKEREDEAKQSKEMLDRLRQDFVERERQLREQQEREAAAARAELGRRDAAVQARRAQEESDRIARERARRGPTPGGTGWVPSNGYYDDGDDGGNGGDTAAPTPIPVPQA